MTTPSSTGIVTVITALSAAATQEDHELPAVGPGVSRDPAKRARLQLLFGDRFLGVEAVIICCIPGPPGPGPGGMAATSS